MVTISSPAAFRLARAKQDLENARVLRSSMTITLEEYGRYFAEYFEAADAVADELVEQGFHNVEGGDS